MNRLSVIVPCRDAGETLGATLASLALQRCRPDEVLLVDDGSVDDSVAIARRRAADRFSPLPLTVLERAADEPAGAAAARVRGTGAATGDRLCFLDADDLLLPDTLEAQLAALARDEGDRGSGESDDVALSLCTWYRYERIARVWCVRSASCAPPWCGHDDLSAWLRGWYHPPAAVLWTRAALERAGGWRGDTFVNQDGDVMMRALARGVIARRADGGTALYRRAPRAGGSLSARARRPEGLLARLDVLARLGDTLAAEGRLQRYAEDLDAATRCVLDDAEACAGAEPLERARTLSLRWRDALPAEWSSAASRRLRRGFGRLRRRTLERAAWGGLVGMRIDGWPFAAHEDSSRAASPASGDAEPASSIARAARTDHRLERDVSPATGLETGLEISVIMPTYQRPRETLQAARSVLAQRGVALELLIVDDGSSDDTVERLLALADARLRVYRRDGNGGVARARNDGIARARAPLIAFLDSDDLWHPDKLRLQLAALHAAGPRVGLVYTGCGDVDVDVDGGGGGSGGGSGGGGGGGGGTIEVAGEGIEGYRFVELLAGNRLHGAGSSALVTRTALALAGDFDASLPAIEDWDMWLRVARFAEIAFVAAPLVHYRDDPRPDRRSRQAAANRVARRRLQARYATEMARHGVRRSVLLESARRELTEPDGSAAAGRRLVLDAALAEPRRAVTLAPWLPYAALPAGARRALRALDARVGPYRLRVARGAAGRAGARSRSA